LRQADLSVLVTEGSHCQGSFHPHSFIYAPD